MNVKTRTNDRQKETAYVLYMILGSFFHGCICRTGAFDNSLYMYYREMKPEAQIRLEAQVIAEAGRVLRQYEKLLAVEMAEVILLQDPDGIWQILFRTGFETVEAEVDRKGNFRIRWRPETAI